MSVQEQAALSPHTVITLCPFLAQKMCGTGRFQTIFLVWFDTHYQSGIGGSGVLSEHGFSVLLKQLGCAPLLNHDGLWSVKSVLKELVNGRISSTYRRSDRGTRWNMRTEATHAHCTLFSLFVYLGEKQTNKQKPQQISENRESASEILMTEAVKALAFSLNSSYW